jgi:hypothetical protein
VEADAMKKLSIKTHICPSFMGDINQFKPTYKYSKIPKLYTSVSGDDFKLYGWDKIDKLAKYNPKIEFHLYGNSKKWESKYPNVIIHGRVPIKQFNEEIEKMQGGLRLTKFDGFSEIVAKSLLMAQYPVSIISYPYTLDTIDIEILPLLTESNIEGRNYYLKIINNYPWSKQHKKINSGGKIEK